MSQDVKLLFVGGCRSGKSKFAEQWVSGRFAKKIFIAPLDAQGDEEMIKRIALHQQSRGKDWLTIEEPINVAKVLLENQSQTDVFLVDCLTLWLSNLMLAGLSDSAIEKEVGKLQDAINTVSVPVVMVANEVGLGIVPEAPLARRFRDLAGWTNQQIAESCSDVVFMAAGLPMQLKGDCLKGN